MSAIFYFELELLAWFGEAPAGVGDAHQPHEARSVWRAVPASQRHQREGAGAGVELGRNIVVRLFVT